MSLFSYVNQSRFPRLWHIFQTYFGGTKGKKALALYAYNGQKRILEIGCSVGNVADAFRNCAHVSYTGIDIDNNAISMAQSRFINTGFVFKTTSVEEYSQSGALHDYILVPCILHHVDDVQAISILKNTKRLAAAGALVNIYDPAAMQEGTGGAYIRWFNKLEQGSYRRDHSALEELIVKTGLRIREKMLLTIKPGFPGLPPVYPTSCFIAEWAQ
jgi:ubiquinone/menaquinone biosynthesis C-methylase UbiE